MKRFVFYCCCCCSEIIDLISNSLYLFFFNISTICLISSFSYILHRDRVHTSWIWLWNWNGCDWIEAGRGWLRGGNNDEKKLTKLKLYIFLFIYFLHFWILQNSGTLSPMNLSLLFLLLFLSSSLFQARSCCCSCCCADIAFAFTFCCLINCY